jgi:integrase
MHNATGHVDGNTVQRTYQHANPVPLRRRAMDWWGVRLAEIVKPDTAAWPKAS